MRIAVWHTGHEIADTVARAVYDGLQGHEVYLCHTGDFNAAKPCDIHIGYGILRGMDEVFRQCDRFGKPWLNIDRGYWKPSHYVGYYRVSLRGTQQTLGLDKLDPDYERWDALKLPILTRLHDISKPILLCQPTEHVCSFFNIRPADLPRNPGLIVRRKDAAEPLQKELDKCSMVRTFNSSVGWEALRQGIPVISDVNHSIIGAYQKQVDQMSRMGVQERRRFFAVQASLQLSLEEIKAGKIWPLIQRLISASSGSTIEKPFVAT